MYSLFIVFSSGHNIKIKSYEFLENAELDARYHAQYAKCDNAWFEVVKHGDVCMSTR